MKSARSETVSLVQTALLAALIILLAMTPIGYIPLGFTRATIIHVPVILGAVLLGPKKGAFLGFLFGLTSLINNTVNPTPTSFCFSPFYSLGEVHGNFFSLVICFIPRILIGVTAWLAFWLCMKLSRSKKPLVPLSVAGLTGALTNTLLVMNMIYFFFAESYAAANEVSVKALYTFILGIIGINGVPEAIVAAILTAAVGSVLLKITRRPSLPESAPPQEK